MDCARHLISVRGISLALGNRDDGAENPSNASLIVIIDNSNSIQCAKLGIHIIGRQKIANDCHYRARKGAWRARAVLEFPEKETVPFYVKSRCMQAKALCNSKKVVLYIVASDELHGFQT